MSAGIELLIAFVVIVVSGVFVMSEAALISARKARLQQYVDEGAAQANVALDLANSPNNFLATVQIFITLLGTLLGAFTGATLAQPFANVLGQVPTLAPHRDALALTIVVLLTTYFSLIIGELVPKQLALNNPERAAIWIAPPMRFLTRMASPLVRFLNFSSAVVIRLLGVRLQDEAPVTEEEIKVMIDQGTLAGTFHEVERHMVEHVFRLGDLTVGALMTPRTEIAWLDVNDSAESIYQTIKDSRFSRYPVAQGNLDNVLGVIQTKDLLARLLIGEKPDLRAVMQSPIYIPETMSVFKVLEALRMSGVHTALVIDEYGGVQGLVTLNDVLEEIVGDAMLPSSGTETPQVTRRVDGSLLLDGMLPTDRFKQVLKLKTLPDEEDGNYQTLGGFVMTQLGRIPMASEYFELEGWRFEVVDMDGHRVDKVLVSPVTSPDVNAGSDVAGASAGRSVPATPSSKRATLEAKQSASRIAP
jgi:putative hemolysin